MLTNEEYVNCTIDSHCYCVWNNWHGGFKTLRSTSLNSVTRPSDRHIYLHNDKSLNHCLVASHWSLLIALYWEQYVVVVARSWMFVIWAKM